MSEPNLPDQAGVLRELVLARTGGRVPKRIAVVANAPVSVSPARARLVDEADLVIRMTTFALDADAPRIGRRTDVVVLHRAVRPGPDTFRDHARRLYLLAEPGRGFWEQELVPPWWPNDLELVPISNRSFTRWTRGALGLGRVEVAWPTTGTLTVHLARRLFPHARILLIGSTLSEPAAGAGGVLEHQWGAPVRVTPEHRLTRERRALARWRAEGWLEVVA
jgi:hypothetical protein